MHFSRERKGWRKWCAEGKRKRKERPNVRGRIRKKEVIGSESLKKVIISNELNEK